MMAAIAPASFLPLTSDPPPKAARPQLAPMVPAADLAGTAAAASSDAADLSLFANTAAAAAAALAAADANPLAAVVPPSSKRSHALLGTGAYPGGMQGAGLDTSQADLRTAVALAETTFEDPSSSLDAVCAALKHLRSALSVHYTVNSLAAHGAAFDHAIVPVLAAILSAYLKQATSRASAPAAAAAVEAAAAAYAADASLSLLSPSSSSSITTLGVPVPLGPAPSSVATTGSGTVREFAGVPDEAAFDALWCLTNIGAGDSPMTRLLTKHGVVQVMPIHSCI
jgi:hypothetical protein